MSSSAVSVSNLTKTFGSGSTAMTALNAVSVDIADNEFFTLLGPSGCGKTTLLRLIAGFEHASSGQIRLHGEEISHLPPYQRPVNTVFQSYALFPHMSVAENIGFGLEMLNKPKAEIKSKVDEMLQLVQMEALADRRTAQISGGQQQRVALARALAPQPRVLLLDEPLSALDYKLRKNMQIELKRLQEETGITFIFVTHDQEEALTMSDRIAVMNKGQILQVGTPHDIYEHPTERFVADFIGDTNFLEATVATKDHSGEMELAFKGKPVVRIMHTTASIGDTLSLAIRPEHATLVDASSPANLQGQLTNVVYSGTDTHYHIALEDTSMFAVRQQNRGGKAHQWQTGQTVGIVLDKDAVQVLRD